MDKPKHDTVVDDVQAMYLDYDINAWNNLALFNMQDVTDYLKNNFCSGIIQRDIWSMGYVWNYRKIASLEPADDLTMTDVINVVDIAIHPTVP